MSTIIEINTSEAVSNLAKLREELEATKAKIKNLETENKSLVQEMQDLSKAGQENSEQFKKAAATLENNRRLIVLENAARGVTSDAIRTQSKQLEALMRLGEKEESSLNAMRKRLTDLRAVYDNLEDQESEYAKSVLSDINAMNEAVKSQEEAQGIYSRNVGDYYRDLSKSTNKVKETTEGANKVTSALASSFGSMGMESKIAESGIKGMTIAQTGLEGATKLLNSVAEAGGIQAAANHAMDILRTKQQGRLAAATAAQTAAQNANTIATKAVAVATMLWNKALSVNPVFLIAAGVAALATGIALLVKKLSDDEKAQKKVNQAFTDFESVSEKRKETDKALARGAEELAQKTQAATDDELNNAKLRGASARELQKIQEKANIEMIKQNQALAQKNLESAKTEYNAKLKIIKTLTKLQGNLSEEQKQQLKDLKKEVKDLGDEIPNLELAVDSFPQAIKNAETEATLNAREYAKERAQIAKDVEKVIEDTAINAIENTNKKAIESRKLAYKREIEEIKGNEKYTSAQKAKLIKASKQRLDQDLAAIDQASSLSEFQRLSKAEEEKLKLKIESEKSVNKNVEKLNIDAENLRYTNLLKANELQKAEAKYTKEELENLETEHQNKITGIQTKAKEDRANIARLAWENEFTEKQNALIESQAKESEFTSLHLEQLKEEKDNLKREDFANEEEYQRAVLDLDREITQERLSLAQQLNAEQQAQMEALGDLLGSLSGLFGEFGDDMGAFGAFSKALALVEIQINTAEAIAKAVAGAMDVGFPANIAAVAVGIATVTANMAKAKTLLSNTSVPKYAHGGFVPGYSTTGDKVPIMANSGELILNKEQQRIFEVIGNQNTTIDYELMYGAFSRAIGEMKSPTVVYSEFVDFQKNLATFDENSKITM